FMARPIKRSHPGIVFGPHAKVEKLVVNLLAGREKLPHVSPIHADEMNRASPAIPRHQPQSCREEVHELGLGHFSRAHGEFPMSDRAVSCGMAVDWHVIWGVAKHDISSLPGH